MTLKNWHFFQDFKTRQIVFICILTVSFVFLFSLWIFQTSRVLENFKKEFPGAKIFPQSELSYFKEEFLKFRQLLELNIKEIRDLKSKLEQNLK